MIQIKILVIGILWILTINSVSRGQVIEVGDDFFSSEDIMVYDGHTRDIGTIREGRPMLLDFGSTGCAPCLKSLATISAILEQLGYGFDAYMVTKEAFGQMSKFAERRLQLDMPIVPIIYGDTILNRQFPHYTEPHLVWIDSKGIVRAITDHSHLDINGVRRLMEGQELVLPRKRDYPYNYDNSMMMFRPDNVELGMIPTVFEQTLVGGIVPHVIPRVGVEIDSLHGFIRYYAYNEPLVNLYLSILGKKWKYDLPSSHIEWEKGIVWQIEMEDRMTDAPPSDSLPLYSYEMVFPLGHPVSYYGEKGKKRLDEYFGMKTTLSSTLRNCLVIESGQSISIEENNHSKTNLEQVIKKRNNRFGAIPIIDETGISGQEKMKIFVDKSVLKDDALLKEELERIGFKVSARVLPVETLRFSLR